MNEYIPTIGLEIHAELKTTTKMFCRSKNDASEKRPNSNICPVCMAHPGTLPVINREAVRHVLRVGTALGSKLADYTEFDRKNYFYPDLPKGYQISQYEFPLVQGGAIGNVAITRIHLEEDTASSIHDENNAMTLIDYNRAGVPLMELVTEPVIRSAEQAGQFARELQLLLRYLGVSDADMEKGQMRVEANVSVSNTSEWGTKTEIKNLNSFRAMERAVAYEIKRQTELLKGGEKVVQQTMGWDEVKQATFPQRIKEGSADYRYFPDPDIPSLRLSEIPDLDPAALKASLPELPWQRRERYRVQGIKPGDADLLTKDTLFGDFFDALSKDHSDMNRIKLAVNYICNDLVKIVRDNDGRETQIHREMPISVQYFSKIIDMLAENKVSSRAGKDLLAAVISENRDPETLATERDLYQKSDAGQLEGVIDEVIAANQPVVADFKAGKAAALEYLVGQGMRQLKGAANPQMLRDLIKGKLG